jgi:hypothetical protein
MGLDINIETKHDSYYNNNYIFLHKDLNYNQMYIFVFHHGDNFWTFLTIKDVQNQKSTKSIKRIQYMCI